MVCDALDDVGMSFEEMARRTGYQTRRRLSRHFGKPPSAFNPGFHDLMEGFEAAGLMFCGHPNTRSYIQLVSATAERLGKVQLAKAAQISRTTLWRVREGEPFSARTALDLASAMRLPICVSNGRVLRPIV